MRNGRWVTTSKQIEGAYSAAGRTYGIYQAGGKTSTPDGGSVETDEHVAIIRPDGTNLMRLSADGDGLEQVTFRPSELPDLQELTDLTLVPRPGVHRA